MHKLNMALHATGNVVDINAIGTGDSLAAVPLANRWQIQYGSNGYAIRYTGSSSMAMRVQENISPGTGVITGTYQSNSYFHWNFESAPGVFLFDSVNHTPYISVPTKYLNIEANHTLAMMQLKVVVSGAPDNDQTVTWSESNSSYGVVSASGTYITTKHWIVVPEETLWVAMHSNVVQLVPSITKIFPASPKKHIPGILNPIMLLCFGATVLNLHFVTIREDILFQKR